MTRPLVRAVFAVLVAATIGAFFLTQQLKGDTPLVLRFATKPALAGAMIERALAAKSPLGKCASITP